MKRLIICISAGIIIALVLSQLYSLYLHPEICFFRDADATSTRWEQQLRQQGHTCYILGGGSEIRSSLSPRIMQQEGGIHAVNTATAAPFGLAANAAIALNHLQKGDTLVLSVISVSDENAKAKEGGIKLVVQLFGKSAFTRGGIPFNPDSLLAMISSDAGNMFVTAIRKLTRGYSYIYSVQSTVHPDGWMEIHQRGMEKAAIPAAKPTDLRVSPTCTGILMHAKNQCREIGADFVVMLPVGYTNLHETPLRLLHALQITRLGIPVLRDERLGRMTDTTKLADTTYHLNAEGTVENSRIIAHLLAAKSYWTEAELLERLRALGIPENAETLP
ncbi:MAG: hypothetical protein E7032_02385 [Akkermansiaceae bacterium]|nr:hypothetical protein [Akkermansiaceae bacterium]